jgi:hypothetical protein
MPAPNTIHDVWKRVLKGEPDECWEWQGSRFNDDMGYGQMKVNGFNCRVHRVAYESHYGEHPGVRQVLHACDNPICCNPAHLRLGSPADNMADKVKRGRWKGGAPRGVGNGRAKLNPQKVIEIRQRLAANEYTTLKALAMEYGISKTTIRGIRDGIIWKGCVAS